MSHRLWDKLEEIILLILLIGMVTFMTLQIIARFIFSHSLSWTEELVRYLFIWSVFLSLPFCIKKGLSIRILLLRKKNAEKVERILPIILFVFFAFLLVQSFHLIAYSLWSGQRSPALQIPMIWIHLAPTVAFFLSCVRLFERILGVAKQ